MSFERPYLLLSLLLIPLAVGIWRLAERRCMRYAVRFTNLDVLATVVGRRSWSRYVPPVLAVIGLSVLLVSLARPQVERQRGDERATVILVMDTSRSMQAQDVRPTRLGAAQKAADVFLDHVPKQVRVGLVVFAGEAQVATPPTRDHALVRQSVDDIGSYLIYGGTAIGDALKTAVDLGKQTLAQDQSQGQTAAARTTPDSRTLAAEISPRSKHLVSILFLSDGAQTRGTLQPLQGAQLARDAGFPVYTVALGTPTGTVTSSFGFGGIDPNGPQRILVPPDPQTLHEIAELTGGQFTEARTAKTLDTAYEKLGSSLGRKPAKSEITFVLVGIAAILLVGAGVLSVQSAPRLP